MKPDALRCRVVQLLLCCCAVAVCAQAGAVDLLRQPSVWRSETNTGSIRATSNGLLLESGVADAVFTYRQDLTSYASKVIEFSGTFKSSSQHAAQALVVVRTQAFDGTLRQAGGKVLATSTAGKAFRLRIRVDRAASSLLTEIRTGPATSLLISELQAVPVAYAAAEDMAGDGQPLALSAASRHQLGVVARAMALTRYFGQAPQHDDAAWESGLRPLVQRLEQALSAEQQLALLRQAFAPLAPAAKWSLAKPGTPLGSGETGPAWHVQQTYHGFGGGRRWYRSSWEPLAAGAVRGSVSIPLEPDGLVLQLPRGADQVPAAAPVLADDVKPRYAVTDRATRLLAVMQLWGVLYYFYPEVLPESVWETMLSEALDGAAMSGQPEQLHVVLQHMMSYLHDGHAWVQGPHYLNSRAPRLRILLSEGRAFVAARGSQTDACEASVLPAGSEVLRIDGLTIGERRLAMQYQRKLASDVAQERVDEQLLLAGFPASVAVVQYRIPDGTVLQAKLKRDTPYYEVACDEAAPPVATVGPGIVKIDLAAATDDTLLKEMPRLLAASTIIIDARQYIASSLTFLGHFIREPISAPLMAIPVMTEPERQRWQWQRSQRTIKPVAPLIGAKLFFLIGGGSISAAETYLQTARFAGLGTMIGESTAGTTGDVAGLVLAGAYQAYWTGLHASTQDGRDFHGVTPHILLRQDPADAAAGIDTVLQKAIALARGDLSH